MLTAPTHQQVEVIEPPGGLALADEMGVAKFGVEPVRIAVVGEPVVDPTQASVVSPTDMLALDLLYDGLTSWDAAAGAWRPHLAESLTASADGLIWTLQLGEHRFSDGSVVTAMAVQRSLERLMAEPDSIAGRKLDVVAALSVVSDLILDIELHQPFAPLPGLLSSPVFGIVPDGVLDGSVGSGPVTIQDTDRVQFVDVASEADAIESRRDGAVDLAFVSPSYEGQVELSAISTVEVQFAMNVTSPMLLDPEVRRAIVGIDPSAVAEAGYGRAAVPFAGGEAELPYPLQSLSIAYVDDDLGQEAAMADALQGELVAIGASATASALELDDFVATVAAGNHEVIRTGAIGLFPSADSRLAPYVSDSADNVSGYANEAFDALLDEARFSGDVQAYADAWAMLEADAVVLPVATLKIRALAADHLVDLQLRHDGSLDLSSVWAS